MERFRGSSDIPLTQDGLEAAHTTAQQLARKGGLDRILTSDLGRTRTTAQILSHYTRAPITQVTPALQPWHLGSLEGQQVTPEKIDLMNHLIRHEPDLAPPGRGPESTSDGESFNQFSGRVLPLFDQLLKEHVANPSERTGVVTHFRNKKLFEAWVRKGALPDYQIDPEEMTQEGGPPGSITRVSSDPRVGIQFNDVDLRSPTQLPGGIYIIRHEKTPWNRPDPTGISPS